MAFPWGKGVFRLEVEPADSNPSKDWRRWVRATPSYSHLDTFYSQEEGSLAIK